MQKEQILNQLNNISEDKKEKLSILLNKFKQLKITLSESTLSFAYGFKIIKLDLGTDMDVLYYEDEDIKDLETVNLIKDYKYIVSRIERYLRNN